MRMLSGVIDAQKADDARFPPQGHRQQALHILLLHHRVQLRAFYLPNILHEIDPVPFKGLQPGGNDLHRNFLQIVLFGAHTVPDELVGVHSDAVGCVQLINIAAVCTKIVIDDTQQVMGRFVQIVPAAGELLDAAVQHRGDVQLFRQMRPARFQPEHLFILLLDGDQEHQDHRNADGQIDQRQTVVHDLDRDREQRQHQIGPRRQKHAPADARPVLQQQAAVQRHGHHRNDHGNGIPCSAVIDIGRIERIIQPGELRYDHQRKAHTANGPHRLHPLEGCVFFRRQEHCTDVIVKKQQRQLHEEKVEKIADADHPEPQQVRPAPEQVRHRIAEQQHRCRDLHPVDPASLLRPIIFCDPEVQTRHRTEQTAPQQQHTVYDLATHPVSSFRVNHKIYPYYTLFFLRLQSGRRKRASHPYTGRTPFSQNQIRTGSCGRLQTRRRWRSGTWPAGRRLAASSSPPRRHRR